MILPRTALAAIGLAALLVAFVALRPLLPVDETRYLDVAWEMWLGGDNFHLTRNFDLYAHKPPLLFWLINLVWSVTGVAEFPARLIGPGFAVALALATARLGRRLWPGDGGIGVRAIAVLCGFPVFLIYASATMFDTMLALAVVFGVGALWRIGQGGGGTRDWLAFGAALAFGTYAKGPVIFVHLLPVLLAMPLWAADCPRGTERLKGFGIAFAFGLALVALWLVPAIARGSAAYREELLWTQSAARVGGGMAHDRPAWFLVALLPVLLFPWGWSWRLWRGLAPVLRGDPAARMVMIWAGAALVLFSLISGKQAHYLMPEYPAVALLLARGLVRAGEGRGGSLAPLAPALIGLLALALAAGLIPASGDLADLAPLPAVALFGALNLVLGLAAWRLPFRAGHVLAGAGVAALAHLLIATTGLRAAHDAGAIAARLAPAADRGLAVSGITYNAEFNFAARLTRPVATPATPAELAAWSAAHPGGLVFGPVDRVPLTAAPETTLRYHGLTWGFWPAGVAAVSVRE
ncbi:ArnT family glycosyltransferase [Albidovulum sp.]|uniref:ArnT family glycosyltransferase n=1 Tax=Albidovulum sp. TaxID=1872424 RepID=UPI0039B8582A